MNHSVLVHLCQPLKAFSINGKTALLFLELSSDGTYLRAPKYYGTCDDDADTSIAGVLQVLTEEEYNNLKAEEHEARRPYPSWIGYLDTMTWGAPVPRPADAIMNGGNVRYQWDEATVNWIPQT